MANPPEISIVIPVYNEEGDLPWTGERSEVGYAFIHGNWSLCNSRPDGRYCGVNNELDVLRETGCYADFTLPSAPRSRSRGRRRG